MTKGDRIQHPRELTNQLMRELDLIDRPSKILQVVRICTRNCARFADQLAEDSRLDDSQKEVAVMMSAALKAVAEKS